MGLSEFIRRNIIETRVGGVANKFKFHKRRDTLFFEELLARYVAECEKEGFGPELIKIGQKWMFLYYHILLPEAIKKIPPVFFLNTLMKKIWVNMGLMDDFHIEKTDEIIRLTTKNEGMTRSIGANGLMIGFYIGIVNVLFDSSVKILEVKQEKESCTYTFRLNKNHVHFEGKSKESYRKLNEIVPIEGYTL